ncbi:hypothetical protein D3C85_1335870 [compost metagenome]
MQLGQHLVHLPVGGGVTPQGILQHGAGAEPLQPWGQVLGHELAAAGGGLLHPSVMGLQLTGQQGEQGALAAAIGANQAQAIAALDAEIDVVKQGEVSRSHLQGVGTHQCRHALAL